MSGRKEQSIQAAIGIIAEEGYSSLSMRAVARASGLKLGALQYHFPTWKDLLRGVAGHISHQYFESVAGLSKPEDHLKLADIVRVILDDEPGDALNSDKLFPQLWAMALVEPIMDELLGEIYGYYLDIVEKALIDENIPTPRVHARVLMTLLESSSLFLTWDPRVKNIKMSERELLLAYLDTITSS